MPYHLADTAWSPRRVLRTRTAHCLEGAIFAAAALRVLGFPPLLLDLEAMQDTDRVLAVFRVRGHWGAMHDPGWRPRVDKPRARGHDPVAMSGKTDDILLRTEALTRFFGSLTAVNRVDVTV